MVGSGEGRKERSDVDLPCVRLLTLLLSLVSAELGGFIVSVNFAPLNTSAAH